MINSNFFGFGFSVVLGAATALSFLVIVRALMDWLLMVAIKLTGRKPQPQKQARSKA